MAKNISIYYATNRAHTGPRWSPTGYGRGFSSDGMENLRFGKVTVKTDPVKVRKYLGKSVGFGKGDGSGLSGYFKKLCKTGRTRKIRAFEERIDHTIPEGEQDAKAFGSKAMFAELQAIMLKSSDVLIYIHGFNVSWNDAVGSALALQEQLNHQRPDRNVGGSLGTSVVLYSWPSDGSAMPFAAYKSDRSDAVSSGKAVGRGFLKLRDFLASLRSISGDCATDVQLCGRDMHLLCHSMGNYVLQNALERLADFSAGSRMPRLFNQVFLCSPDVDDDVLEPGGEMGRLHEIGASVSVYFNTGDLALGGSDVTKGNPDRLGSAGAARPAMVHAKVHQIDCSKIVGGFMEHSYYMDGVVNDDIQMTLAGLAQSDAAREQRERDPIANNTWVMRKRRD